MPNYNPGDTVTTTARFLNSDGTVPMFAIAPVWSLYNAANLRIDSGNTVNTPATPTFTATVALPTLDSLYAGSSEMRVEISGVDVIGKSWQSNTVISINAVSVFEPHGIFYINGGTNSFTVEFATAPTSASYSITDMQDGIVLPSTVIPVDALTATERGFLGKVSIPVTTFDLGCKYPYLVTINVVTGSKTDIQQRPLYVLTNRVSQLLISMKQYLDKAQLVEIDPTLQWSMEELTQFLYDGMNHINANKPEITYWNLQDFNPGLTQMVVYAGAFVALNARYLAEGLNDFDFQGASTQLTLDRKSPISYKIEELKGYLDDNLPPIKTALIRSTGVGTPPQIPGAVVSNDVGRVARLGISIGPMTNRPMNPSTLRNRMFYPF